MDFFDVLRKGCTFGGTKRSKAVNFTKQNEAADDDKTLAKGVRSLDFFGGGAKAPKRVAVSQPEAGSGPREDVEEEAAAPAEAAATSGGGRRADDTTALRRKHRIHASAGAPEPMASFDEMAARGVPSWLVQNLRGLGFSRPTAVQMQCFPAVLTGGHVLASAPTGSGKTMAFLGPLLALLGRPGKEFARVVVIDPSRELAKQTLDEFNKLTVGKKWTSRLLDKLSPDKAKNIKRLDVAVVTPLRMAQLLREDRVSLDATRHLVLDEADKLLDLGFAPQIDEILSYCPKDEGKFLQTLMFSATLPPVVCELAESILTEPLRVHVGDMNAAAPDVEQKLHFCTNEDGKLSSFRQLVRDGKVKPPALIFVQSKERAKHLFAELVFDGLFVDAIHADRTRQQRDGTVRAFRTGKIWMLICTDLMARGVDFKGIETVVNYDFPQSAATYIHRIGRTGRAGRSGSALTLFTIQDFEFLRTIVGVMRQSGCEVPEWMLRLKARSKREKRTAEWRPPSRRKIVFSSGTAGFRRKKAKLKVRPQEEAA